VREIADLGVDKRKITRFTYWIDVNRFVPANGASKDFIVLFVGTVQDTIHSPSISRVDVRLSIHESWKGTIGDEIWLHTAGDSAACGVNFERGKTYTVLAILNEDGTYSTTLCSGTEEYQQSSPLMKYLRTLQTSSSSSSSSRTSSSSDMCEPYVCPSGKTYPACTPDGHHIYYFAYPCQFDSGNIFTDVPQNHRYYDAIKFVKERGIVSGYSDGSFHPDSAINRAEFTKIIVGAQYGSDLVRKCDTRVLSSLRDIDLSAWYAQSLCAAVVAKVIGGYPDGTFRPENPVNFAEAAKIIATTFNLPQLLIYYPEWWQGPIQSMSFALPPTYRSPDQFVTRGEMAFMIKAVLERNGGSSSSSRSSRSASSSRSAIAKDGCKIGGCSAQLCVDQYDSGISTCEWSPAYVCYQSATCERQPNGQCAWTQTRNLTQCLNNAR
jgi:hypothetical protein